MGQRITVNQTKGGLGSGIIVVTANTTGYLSTTANAPAGFRANTAGETISAMRIAEVAWSGAAASTLTISRGGNTVWVGYGTGYVDFQANQMRLEASTGGDALANVVFQTAGNMNFVIKLHKSSGA